MTETVEAVAAIRAAHLAHGYTALHDDTHSRGELHALALEILDSIDYSSRRIPPWVIHAADKVIDKYPKAIDRIDQVLALLFAERERLVRAASPTTK